MSTTRRSRVWLVAGAALLTLAFASPATAQAGSGGGKAPATPPAVTVIANAASDTTRFAFVVSGGVSLGSYQAGLSWGMVELMRRSRDKAFREQVQLCRRATGAVARACADTAHSWKPLPPMRLVEAVGASAGNINALLSGIEWCRDSSRVVAPEQSLFWKMWTWTGWEQLFSETAGGKHPDAVFQRAFFDTLLTTVVDSELASARTKPRCEIPLGVVTTRLLPDSVRLTPTSPIWAATQRFVVVWKLVADSSGRGFHFGQVLLPALLDEVNKPAKADDSHATLAYYAVGTDSADKPTGDKQPLRSQSAQAFGKVLIIPPDARSGVISDSSIYAVVKASGAFPFAFAPVLLRYWDGADYVNGHCSASVDGCTSRHSWFVDGGVFDNNPLDLAITMYRASGADSKRSGSDQIVYISPGTLRGALRTARERQRQVDTTASRGIGALVQLANQGVAAATQYELQSAARHLASDTVAQEWVRTSSRAMPIVGEHLQHFAAFLGRPFREFDFYAGIYDAFDYIARNVLCSPDASTRYSKKNEQFDIEQCVATATQALLDADVANLGPTAPRLLAELFEYEHRGRISLREPPTPPMPVTEQHSRLVHAVWRSLRHHSGMQPTGSCTTRRGAWALMCGDGFSDVLLGLKSDTVAVHYIKAASQLAKCDRSHWATAPRDDDCVGEGTLAALMQHEKGTADALANSILKRVWDVERGLELDTLTNYPGVAKLATFGFLVTSSSPKSERRHSHSSVPPGPATGWQRVARYGLPYAISTNTEGGGFEVNYLPAWYLKERLALELQLTPINWRPHQDDQRAQAIFGADLLARWRRRSLIVSDLELGGGVLASRLGDAEPDVTGAAYLLGGHLRAGFRNVLHKNPSIIRNGHWAVSLGLADVNGVVYWLFR